MRVRRVPRVITSLSEEHARGCCRQAWQNQVSNSVGTESHRRDRHLKHQQERYGLWGYECRGVRGGANEAAIGVLVMVGGGTVRAVVLTAADDERQVRVLCLRRSRLGDYHGREKRLDDK